MRCQRQFRRASPSLIPGVGNSAQQDVSELYQVLIMGTPGLNVAQGFNVGLPFPPPIHREFEYCQAIGLAVFAFISFLPAGYV